MNQTLDPFFAMFAQANTTVWPMLIVWYAIAIAAVGLAIKPRRSSNRLIAAFLATYYIWLGVVFFFIYYSALSDHALAAGAMFVLGGLLFLIAGVVRQDLKFEARWDLLGVTGGAFIAYALVIYPVIGMLTGRFFPAAPLFGLAPCPSTLFTAGLLLWTRPPMPMYVLVVPLFWLMAQTPAEAVALGVIGDIARPLVGLITASLLVWREFRSVRARIIGGAILLAAALLLGNDVGLMDLAAVFLVATFVGSVLRQRRAPVTGGSMGTPVNAPVPAK